MSLPDSYFVDGINAGMARSQSPSNEQQHEHGTKRNSMSSPDLCNQCSAGRPLQTLMGNEKDNGTYSFRDLFDLSEHMRTRMPATVFRWGLSTMRQNREFCSLCSLVLTTLAISGVVERTNDPDARVVASFKRVSHLHHDCSLCMFNSLSLVLEANDLPLTSEEHLLFPVSTALCSQLWMMRWDNHLIRYVKSSKTTLRKLFHTAKSLRRK